MKLDSHQSKPSTVILTDKCISRDDAQPLLLSMLTAIKQTPFSRVTSRQSTYNKTYSIFQQFITIIFVDSLMFYQMANVLR